MKVHPALLLSCFIVCGCSLITVPVKTAGSIVTTTVETAGKVVTAPFEAVGRSGSSRAAQEEVRRPLPGDESAPRKAEPVQQ